MQNFDDYFPQDPNVHYLNHAAVSPWPKCTEHGVVQFAKENVSRGAAHYPTWLSIEQECRTRLARLINTPNNTEIALAKSTSEALSIIAYGLTWNHGDEVIITSHEFPSNRIVWESLAQFGVKTVIVDINPENPIQAIEDAISDNTRLISVSSVQYASGIKMNLEALSALRKAHNLLLCIDAIQSLGALPFDQTKIDADFIVADGHKWMMAAEGLALLYVRKDRQANLKLHQFGWHMINNRGNYDTHEWAPAKDATRFECGSPNMLGIHALHASLGLIHEIGKETIFEELQLRMTYLIEQLKHKLPNIKILSPIEEDKRAGIITFKPEVEDLKGLHAELMKQGVICAYRGGGIRFSPHFYTRLQTIDEAINTLNGLCKYQSN